MEILAAIGLVVLVTLFGVFLVGGLCGGTPEENAEIDRQSREARARKKWK